MRFSELKYLIIICIFVLASFCSFYGNLSQSTDLNLVNTNNNLYLPQKMISISHDNIWPISGNTTIDLPQSSPFGPRQQASAGYRYDFHRGIDIPADYGTPIHAIADGYVRLVSINETYEQRDDGSIVNIYTSTVIQLKHNVSNWPDTYYSTYLHVNGTQTLVSAGSFVSKGEIIGFVGDDPTTSFPHLHFEIRYDGLYQYHNVNPWEFLPYINTASHEVTLIDITEVNSSYSNISVQLKAQANELDIDEIEITLFDINENLLENRSLSFNKINRNVTENYIEILDNNTISKDNYLIEVFPSKFNGYSSIIHWNYTFIDVPVNSDVNTMKIRGLDVQGLESVVEVNISVDTTAPVITILSPKNITYSIQSVWLNFTTDEQTTWVGYSLDGNVTVTISGNVSLSSLFGGGHSIVVYTNDSKGNMGQSTTIWFSIDTIAPTITIISPINTTYSIQSVWLNFTTDEQTTWVGYSLEGNTNVTISGNMSLNSLSAGAHTIVVYARDAAGNIGVSTTISYSVEIISTTTTIPTTTPTTIIDTTTTLTTIINTTTTTSVSPPDDGGTPGFTLITVISIIAIILVIKRSRKSQKLS